MQHPIQNGALGALGEPWGALGGAALAATCMTGYKYGLPHVR